MNKIYIIKVQYPDGFTMNLKAFTDLNNAREYKQSLDNSLFKDEFQTFVIEAIDLEVRL